MLWIPKNDGSGTCLLVETPTGLNWLVDRVSLNDVNAIEVFMEQNKHGLTELKFFLNSRDCIANGLTSPFTCNLLQKASLDCDFDTFKAVLKLYKKVFHVFEDKQAELLEIQGLKIRGQYFNLLHLALLNPHGEEIAREILNLTKTLANEENGFQHLPIEIAFTTGKTKLIRELFDATHVKKEYEPELTAALKKMQLDAEAKHLVKPSKAEQTRTEKKGFEKDRDEQLRKRRLVDAVTDRISGTYILHKQLDDLDGGSEFHNTNVAKLVTDLLAEVKNVNFWEKNEDVLSATLQKLLEVKKQVEVELERIKNLIEQQTKTMQSVLSAHEDIIKEMRKLTKIVKGKQGKEWLERIKYFERQLSVMHDDALRHKSLKRLTSANKSYKEILDNEIKAFLTTMLKNIFANNQQLKNALTKLNSELKNFKDLQKKLESSSISEASKAVIIEVDKAIGTFIADGLVQYATSYLDPTLSILPVTVEQLANTASLSEDIKKMAQRFEEVGKKIKNKHQDLMNIEKQMYEAQEILRAEERINQLIEQLSKLAETSIPKAVKHGHDYYIRDTSETVKCQKYIEELNAIKQKKPTYASLINEKTLKKIQKFLDKIPTEFFNQGPIVFYPPIVSEVASSILTIFTISNFTFSNESLETIQKIFEAYGYQGDLSFLNDNILASQSIDEISGCLEQLVIMHNLLIQIVEHTPRAKNLRERMEIYNAYCAIFPLIKELSPKALRGNYLFDAYLKSFKGDSSLDMLQVFREWITVLQELQKVNAESKQAGYPENFRWANLTPENFTKGEFRKLVVSKIKLQSERLVKYKAMAEKYPEKVALLARLRSTQNERKTNAMHAALAMLDIVDPDDSRFMVELVDDIYFFEKVSIADRVQMQALFDLCTAANDLREQLTPQDLPNALTAVDRNVLSILDDLQFVSIKQQPITIRCFITMKTSKETFDVMTKKIRTYIAETFKEAERAQKEEISSIRQAIIQSLDQEEDLVQKLRQIKKLNPSADESKFDEIEKSVKQKRKDLKIQITLEALTQLQKQGTESFSATEKLLSQLLEEYFQQKKLAIKQEVEIVKKRAVNYRSGVNLEKEFEDVNHLINKIRVNASLHDFIKTTNNLDQLADKKIAMLKKHEEELQKLASAEMSLTEAEHGLNVKLVMLGAQETNLQFPKATMHIFDEINADLHGLIAAGKIDYQEKQENMEQPTVSVFRPITAKHLKAQTVNEITELTSIYRDLTKILRELTKKIETKIYDVVSAEENAKRQADKKEAADIKQSKDILRPNLAKLIELQQKIGIIKVSPETIEAYAEAILAITGGKSITEIHTADTLLLALENSNQVDEFSKKLVLALQAAESALTTAIRQQLQEKVIAYNANLNELNLLLKDSVPTVSTGCQNAAKKFTALMGQTEFKTEPFNPNMMEIVDNLVIRSISTFMGSSFTGTWQNIEKTHDEAIKAIQQEIVNAKDKHQNHLHKQEHEYQRLLEVAVSLGDDLAKWDQKKYLTLAWDTLATLVKDIESSTSRKYSDDQDRLTFLEVEIAKFKTIEINGNNFITESKRIETQYQQRIIQITGLLVPLKASIGQFNDYQHYKTPQEEEDIQAMQRLVEEIKKQVNPDMNQLQAFKNNDELDKVEIDILAAQTLLKKINSVLSHYKDQAELAANAEKAEMAKVAIDYERELKNLKTLQSRYLQLTEQNFELQQSLTKAIQSIEKAEAINATHYRDAIDLIHQEKVSLDESIKQALTKMIEEGLEPYRTALGKLSYEEKVASMTPEPVQHLYKLLLLKAPKQLGDIVAKPDLILKLDDKKFNQFVTDFQNAVIAAANAVDGEKERLVREVQAAFDKADEEFKKESQRKLEEKQKALLKQEEDARKAEEKQRKKVEAEKRALEKTEARKKAEEEQKKKDEEEHKRKEEEKKKKEEAQKKKSEEETKRKIEEKNKKEEVARLKKDAEERDRLDKQEKERKEDEEKTRKAKEELEKQRKLKEVASFEESRKVLQKLPVSVDKKLMPTQIIPSQKQEEEKPQNKKIKGHSITFRELSPLQQSVILEIDHIQLQVKAQIAFNSDSAALKRLDDAINHYSDRLRTKAIFSDEVITNLLGEFYAGLSSAIDLNKGTPNNEPFSFKRFLNVFLGIGNKITLEGVSEKVIIKHSNTYHFLTDLQKTYCNRASRLTIPQINPATVTLRQELAIARFEEEPRAPKQNPRRQTQRSLTDVTQTTKRDNQVLSSQVDAQVQLAKKALKGAQPQQEPPLPSRTLMGYKT